MEKSLTESPAEPLSSAAAWRTFGNALFSLVRPGLLGERLARGSGSGPETHAAAGDYRQPHDRVSVVVT